MKRLFLKSLVVLTAVLIVPCLSSPVLSQEEPTYSVWSLWLGGHYTGYEDFYKKIGEFDRGEEEAMPEVKLSYSGYKGDQSWNFFGHYYDPKRASLDLSGRSRDIFSGKVSYRSSYRQRATDLLENLMAREAVNQENTPGGKMYTYEHENPDADFGYTRHELKTDFQVKVPGSADLILRAFHRSILEKGDEQKVVSMHCSSCHMVSKSAEVDRRTHTISAGAEATAGPVLLSYMGSYRTFKSEAPTPVAFYDTAQHPVNGTLIEEFGSRTVFDGEEVTFGEVPETEKVSHRLKVRTDMGKKGDILGSFSNSQAKNKSAGLKVKSNSGSLKYVVSPSQKTKIVGLASLALIESDEAQIDLPLWRDGMGEGSGQDFSWTRYSNLTRTVAKGSAEFIYQPNRTYRVFLLAGYEATERDD
ncbi:MAG: GSU2204 family CXXCH-containing (seleno)protein, partial [Candidatus Zixiibacteriota bacterium]